MPKCTNRNAIATVAEWLARKMTCTCCHREVEIVRVEYGNVRADGNLAALLAKH